jgi:hypothetical protein
MLEEKPKTVADLKDYWNRPLGEVPAFKVELNPAEVAQIVDGNFDPKK